VEEVTVTIARRGGASQSYRIRKGLGFQALCAREATPIEFDCREADCGICIVRIVRGLEFLSAKTEAERDFLAAMRAEPDERLACQARITGDVWIQVDDA
jgi:ferredoxin